MQVYWNDDGDDESPTGAGLWWLGTIVSDQRDGRQGVCASTVEGATGLEDAAAVPSSCASRSVSQPTQHCVPPLLALQACRRAGRSFWSGRAVGQIRGGLAWCVGAAWRALAWLGRGTRPPPAGWRGKRRWRRRYPWVDMTPLPIPCPVLPGVVGVDGDVEERQADNSLHCPWELFTPGTTSQARLSRRGCECREADGHRPPGRPRAAHAA